MKIWSKVLLVGLSALTIQTSQAANFVVDSEKMHAFVQFKISHLGFSWLYGRFNDFSGEFHYDKENDVNNKVNFVVNTESVDTNFAERDKHIRSADFLNVDEFPTANFASTSFVQEDDGDATLIGNLTMYGTTKEVTFDVDYIGGGEDPWGGFREGFEATATINPADFGLNLVEKLGAAAAEVELIVSVEGIKL